VLKTNGVIEPEVDVPDHTAIIATLDDKVAFLTRPDSYDEPTRGVETIETHMAWVFLTDRRVYKMKKPVRFSYLDFSTLDARHDDCQAELRLNRRLAADVYLDVVPLCQDAAGHLGIATTGTVVDWLVKMRRLPADDMLDAAIAQGRVAPDRLRPAALHLAAFYASTSHERIGADAYRRHFAEQAAATGTDLARPVYGLPGAQIRRIVDRQLAFLESHAVVFNRRVRGGRIIEAHGDLRPEHVCLCRPPAIIDCLEFRRDYRILDTVDELAFLAMECEQLGAPEVGDTFLSIYREVSGDAPPPALVNFYKSYRAALRAKLTIWHLDDPHVRTPEKWQPLARRYLDLADQYAALLP
jgi:aminoglycoside phosphotransferase family enzyme